MSCNSLPLSLVTSAGIYKQSMGAGNRVGVGLSYRPARLHTQTGGIGSLESILGLLKSLKIRAQVPNLLRAEQHNIAIMLQWEKLGKAT
jgi:hypothetical protein